MIVNASKGIHVVVELTMEDISKILKGEKVYRHSSAYYDENVVAQVYCSNPGDPIE